MVAGLQIKGDSLTHGGPLKKKAIHDGTYGRPLKKKAIYNRIKKPIKSLLQDYTEQGSRFINHTRIEKIPVLLCTDWIIKNDVSF